MDNYINNCVVTNYVTRLTYVAIYATMIGGKFMKNLLGGIITRPILLTKDKEVAATVLGYDYVDKCLVAKVKDTGATIALEDISIYQKLSMNKDNNINGDYLHRLLGSQIKCEVIGYDKGYILSRAKLMQKRVEKYNKGDVVEATVVSASEKALYLEFDEGLSGIMNLNQMTSAKVHRPLDIYSIGDKIKCKIIKKKDGYFELSRLELYKFVTLDLQRGNLIKCRITKKLDDNSGFYVEVISNPQYSGIFDLTTYNKNNKFEIGSTINLRIAKINGQQLRLRTCN